METTTLIVQLAEDAKPVRRLPGPWQLFGLWSAATLLSAAVMLTTMGLRPDVVVQMTRPLFWLEIIALLALISSTAVAALWRAFPDQRQQGWINVLPLGPLLLYGGTVVYRLLVPEATDAPLGDHHGLECSLCITIAALVPAGVLLYLVRKGATTQPRRSGFLALLAAASLGHLLLKFAEANDHVPHFLLWHLLPIVVLGLLGGGLGKKLLVW